MFRGVGNVSLSLTMLLAQDQGFGFIIFYLHYHTMCSILVFKSVDEMLIEKRGRSEERKEER